MFYIKATYTKTCLVVDTNDGVEEELSNDYILSCIDKGIKVQGYDTRFGFYAVKPVNKTTCHYLGETWGFRSYDAYIIPTSAKAKSLTAFRDLCVASCLGADKYNVKVVYNKRDVYGTRSKVVAESGVLKGITEKGEFIVELNGYDEQFRAKVIGVGLPFDFKYLANNYDACVACENNCFICEQEYLEGVSFADKSLLLSSKEFLKLLKSGGAVRNNTKFYITDLCIAISPHKAYELASTFYKNSYKSISDIGTDETSWFQRYDRVRRILRLLAEYWQYERKLDGYLDCFIAKSDADTASVCTHLSITKGMPTLHYIGQDTGRIMSENLFDLVDGKVDVDICGLTVSADSDWITIDSLLGNYNLRYDILKADYNMVETIETKKTALRSALSGRGTCEIAGNGTLLSCSEDKRHSINIPEGVTSLGTGSICLTSETVRIDIPSTVKTIAKNPFTSNSSASVQVCSDKLRIVFRSDSSKAFVTLLSAMWNNITKYFARFRLLSLNSFCLDQSNMDAVLTGLVSTELGRDIIMSTEIDKEFKMLPADEFSTAMYKAIEKYCGRTNLKAKENLISVSLLKKAIRFYKVNHTNDFPELPRNINSLSIMHTPASSIYYRVEDCRQIDYRLGRFISGTARYALDSLFDNLQQEISNYLTNYKRFLVDSGLYTSTGDLSLINVIRYVKINS